MRSINSIGHLLTVLKRLGGDPLPMVECGQRSKATMGQPAESTNNDDNK
jgi:hypothetical protein